MNKKIQIAVLKYIKKVKEVSRGQIINEVSNLENCERIFVQEAINILEHSKEIFAIKKYDSIIADTFTLTNKGYETLGPWYKKKLINTSVLEAIIIGLTIGLMLLILEYNFFI